MHRHADAEPLFRRALAIREQGPEGADLAQSLNGLGNVLQAEGRYKGRPEDAERNAGIASMLAAGASWSSIQAATGCSRATIAKIAKRQVKQAA